MFENLQSYLLLISGAIKNGIPVQKAAAQYKIPTGTLYGRCKKGGIELSKSSNVLWSETDMNKALESVKTGGMSINQVSTYYIVRGVWHTVSAPPCPLYYISTPRY